MKSSVLAVVVMASGFVAACGSSSSVIDRNDPARVVGRESDVRIDAQFLSRITPGSPTIHIACEIRNDRSKPIAVVERSEASYDPASRTITVHVGAEIPAAADATKLVTIASGETKRFQFAASVPMPATAMQPASHELIRLTVNFLNDPEVARQMTSSEISESAYDAWIEDNETVTTNAVPLGWTAGAPAASSDIASRGSSF
jgi:hypothetical protein